MTVGQDAQVRGTHADCALVEQFRTVLTGKRNGLLARLASHDADAPATVERAMPDPALTRAAEYLEEVETALQRVEAGTYGRCESCKEAIPIERLEVVPAAARCVRCQTRSASLLG